VVIHGHFPACCVEREYNAKAAYEQDEQFWGVVTDVLVELLAACVGDGTTVVDHTVAETAVVKNRSCVARWCSARRARACRAVTVELSAKQ
jgi:hypothetical protein